MTRFIIFLSTFILWGGVALSSDQQVILKLEADSAAAYSMLNILENCSGSKEFLGIRSQKNGMRKKDGYEIFLRPDFAKEQDCHREYLFRFFLTSILGDDQPLSLRLVQNSLGVLIGDVSTSTLDISDITRFDGIRSDHEIHICAGQVLFHELYELYHLTYLQGITTPARASEKQIAAAHLYATQKESNLYANNVVKEASKILEDSIFIKFSSRIDGSYTIYHAYYKRGNIYRIEQKSGVDNL